MGTYQTPFKLNKKHDMATPFPKVYGTKNNKKIDMLMNMFVEMQVENLQLQKIVIQLQNRATLESTVDVGCK